MSLLQQLLANNELYLYGDYRSGTVKDLATGKAYDLYSGNRLNNKWLSVLPKNDPSTYTLLYNKGTVNIGTNDFTTVARFRKPTDLQAGGILGLGLGTGVNNAIPMYMSAITNNIAVKFETVEYYPTATVQSNIMRTYVTTCDRDADACFYCDGILQGTSDISSHSTADIRQNTFAVGSLGNGYWAAGADIEFALMINRVLTPTEVAQLTAELEGLKFPTKPWGRVSNIKPKLVGVFETSSSLDFTDLSGVTITSYEGSAILSISGNSIVATGGAGTAWNLLLSDGTYIPLEGSVNDVSGGGNHPVNNGVEFTYYGGGAFQAWSITHN